MEVKYNADGLVPAIAQDADSGEVLMMAWMNAEALAETLQTRRACYFSRSRGKLWRKGETSGNVQEVLSVKADCDGDTLLLTVRPAGPACHTGERTCFHNNILTAEAYPMGPAVLTALRATVEERKNNPIQGSYTNYLFSKGIDKILKKVGEETAEVIIASKNEGVDELCYEAADLLYHLTVLLVEKGLPNGEIYAELAKRHQK